MQQLVRVFMHAQYLCTDLCMQKDLVYHSIHNRHYFNVLSYSVVDW